jgi:superfamily II DNA/RNA helicase
MSFSELGLSPKVLAAVEASGYTTPTPIQAQAIPHVLARRDVVGIAQTGTGKTASFVLPMLTRLESGRARARMPRTLILEPTRELAAQVEENFTRYGQNHKLTVALIIGGVSFEDQIKKLDRGVDILIATPGRLLDLFERGKILMNGVEILVIDEADRMLDMGFIPDIERICKMLPFTRQTLFFSATMPPEIQRLADAFLSNPIRIEASRPATAAATITQRLVPSGREPVDKRAVLRALIREATDFKNAIIFCNRKRDVATLQRSLSKHGFNAGALHGDMDQRSRTQTLDDFRQDKLKLLVASDVAARGLDIPAVSHIFNFDVPTHAEDYVHRIGRTGRAGRTGTAITIASSLERKYVASIEKLTGQPIEEMQVEASAERAASFSKGRADSDGAHEGGGEERRDGRRRSRGGERGRGERGHGERSSGGERAPQREERPAQAVEQPQAAAPEQAPQPRREESRPPRFDNTQPRRDRDRDRNRGRDRERDEAPIIGLGDHVPSFLLRPTRLPTES